MAEAGVIADPERLPAQLDAPLTDRLVSHFNAAFGEKLLDITQTQREPIVQPDGALGDLGRAAVTATDDLVHRSASCKSPRPGKLLNLTNPLAVFEKVAELVALWPRHQLNID